MQDDPYRQACRRGISLLDHVILPSQQRRDLSADEEICKNELVLRKLEEDETLEMKKEAEAASTPSRSLDLLNTSVIGTSGVNDMKMYLREYIAKGRSRRKRRNRFLKKRDEICLKRLDKSLGVKIKIKAKKV